MVVMHAHLVSHCKELNHCSQQTATGHQVPSNARQQFGQAVSPLVAQRLERSKDPAAGAAQRTTPAAPSMPCATVCSLNCPFYSSVDRYHAYGLKILEQHSRMLALKSRLLRPCRPPWAAPGHRGCGRGKATTFATTMPGPHSTASMREGPWRSSAARSAAASSSHVAARQAGTPMPCRREHRAGGAAVGRGPPARPCLGVLGMWRSKRARTHFVMH